MRERYDSCTKAHEMHLRHSMSTLRILQVGDGSQLGCGSVTDPDTFIAPDTQPTRSAACASACPPARTARELIKNCRSSAACSRARRCGLFAAPRELKMYYVVRMKR